MKYKEALEKIARVNAMDYEYQAWAKEALAQPEPWEKFCDSNCVWTDHHPDCKLSQPEQEPVAWYDKDGVITANPIEFSQPLYTTPPQPEKPDQDEVDIRSRLYQRIHELECLLKDIAEYTGEGPPTTDWQGIVKLISDSARNALEDKEMIKE